MSDKINGIDNTRLLKIMDAIKHNPSHGEFIFRVNNTWLNGGHSRSVIRGFYGAEREDNLRTTPFLFEIDQPSLLLGKDEGPTAVEYVLNALAGCLTNSIVCLVAIRGITLTDVESEIEGRFDLRYMFGINGDNGKLYDNIKMKIRIKGQQLTIEEKEFLCELGKKTSLVHKIITTTFPVEISVDNENQNFYKDRPLNRELNNYRRYE
jgi:uncharacterized OsmC-like protein